MPELTFENDAILFLDSSRGIYIPQQFAEKVVRSCVEGMEPDDYEILESGPYHDWYWECWNHVLDNVRIHDLPNDIVYTLYQDGDLWLVPEGCEIPEF